MNHRFLFAVWLSFVFLSQLLWAGYPKEWKIPYGKGPGQVQYYNDTVNPKIEEAAALGPMAFRVVKDGLWVADSIGGKMLKFSLDGKVVKTIKVPNLLPEPLIEDFAFKFNKAGEIIGLWVGDGADLIVRLIDVESGKELVKFGGRGDTHGKFRQIHQIETDCFGNVFVGDYGRNIIAVFSPNGEFVREIPWHCTGFCLDDKGNLSVLTYSENLGFTWNRFSTSGQLIESIHIGYGDLTNPRIWCHDQNGGLIVSFIPAGGFKGLLHFFRISRQGTVVNRFSLRPPRAMNRFFDSPDNGLSLFIAAADYEAAPKGYLTIRNLITRTKAK